MSEKLDTDANDSNNASNSEIAADEIKTDTPQSTENESVEQINVSNTKSDDPQDSKDDTDYKNCVGSIEQQNSTESLEHQLSEEKSADAIERQSSVDNKDNHDRQSSFDDKSQLSTWSFSHWSENYESLEDERPIEDLGGDPKKLILWAAEKNELETMRRLLEEDPNLVNARDNDLYTPLHRASYSNNIEVIKMLLSYDADVSSKTTDGWEALHCACKWDSVEAVSLLLQNGADVNAQTKGHITPLHLAAANASGRRTLELLLWQPYIDPNIKNDAGDTAYDIAYRTGPLGALFEILEESVNVY
ncbi:ankyrin repeat domain-containing protein 49 [Trichonephila inaurata madagascariensis]|uniref:Ankyrin repeat domain-containing protein 49 n=1 Tax=Trichonephila inaurata madagascariensis TaxID=2747483 RepID=A0A8X7BTX6_9ARAC|nr:ankyrin repeat domain-containing protein 49 [Trichonephila inaurata madagascariensis]